VIVVEHLISFLDKKDFSLRQWSNQGLENMHQDNKLIKQSATALGGLNNFIVFYWFLILLVRYECFRP